MIKKKIDNKSILKDVALSTFTTWMIVNSFIGKHNNSYAKDIKGKKNRFDITKFFDETAKSIDDYFSGLFAPIEKNNIIGNSGNTHTGPRITKPIMNIRDYTINEIIELTGPNLYKNLTINKTIKKRFNAMFPIIYTQYQGLKPTGPVTLELVITLPRGESAYNHLATSPTGARGLYQTIQSTFDKYFPQYKHLPLEERKKKAYDAKNNSFAGISHLIYLDDFLMKNDPYYRKASIKEKQRRLIVSYNAGEGIFQRSGFIIENLPNHPFPYKRDAINLSNYVLGLIYGKNYAENTKHDIEEKERFRFTTDKE